MRLRKLFRRTAVVTAAAVALGMSLTSPALAATDWTYAYAGPVKEPATPDGFASTAQSALYDVWGLENRGTHLCLSSNWSGSVYTTPCTGVVYHYWYQVFADPPPLSVTRLSGGATGIADAHRQGMAGVSIPRTVAGASSQPDELATPGTHDRMMGEAEPHPSGTTPLHGT